MLYISTYYVVALSLSRSNTIVACPALENSKALSYFREPLAIGPSLESVFKIFDICTIHPEGICFKEQAKNSGKERESIKIHQKFWEETIEVELGITCTRSCF